MNNIGDKLNLSGMEPLKVDDAELVKNKLEIARHNQHRSLRHGEIRSNSAFGVIS